ncbi:hypothetical protein GCM10020255_077220 [Rhodococcus baikonurensis]
MPGSDPLRSERPRRRQFRLAGRPCAELVQDGRGDDTVDLALGTYNKGALTPNTDATAILHALAEQPANAEVAPMDIALLKAARTARC